VCGRLRACRRGAGVKACPESRVRPREYPRRRAPPPAARPGVSSTFTTVLYVAGAIGVIAAALKYAASVARWLRAPPPPPFMFTTGSIQGGGGREDLQPIIENQSGERLRVHVTVTAAGETFSDDERIVNPGVTNICVAVPSSVHDALGASAVMQPQSYAVVPRMARPLALLALRPRRARHRRRPQRRRPRGGQRRPAAARAYASPAPREHDRTGAAERALHARIGSGAIPHG
jgi:hypothetical protein